MSSESFDLIISGGAVVDGSGAPRVNADVGIRGDRVAAIGNLGASDANERLDASGCCVAPGFIDAHTHDDRLVLSDPAMTPKVSQGVTSVVAGNCGLSLAPLQGVAPPPPLTLLGEQDSFQFATVDAYMDEVRNRPPAVNIALLCGHLTLRAGTMHALDRPATGDEIAAMGERLDAAMSAGCIGLSTGLAYPPAIEAPTSEIIALAERAARHDGIYVTHMRNEKDGLVDSVRETLEIGRAAALPVVISHHKAVGRPNFGLTRDSLALIESARASQRVDLDVYPYTASSTVLLADWVPSAEKVLVTWSRSHPECGGRDLAEIALEWDVSVEVACARLHPAGAIYFQMDEADLRRVLSFEDSMIGSDGLPHDEFPHPRLWGTFPRVLGHYSRDEGLFSLEEAVRKMTSVAARVFGLEGRGLLAEGQYADVVVFDPERVRDMADFDNPVQMASGIETVLVNGQIVWQNGHSTASRPGRALTRIAAH